MTLDEALSQAVEGARVTAPHMQPGCYVEHSFSRGFLRCWRVDTPDEEPNRTQCDFIAGDLDRNAEWRILTSEEQYPPKPKLTGGWGALKIGGEVVGEVKSITITNNDPAIRKRPAMPIGDVIEVSGTVTATAPAPDPLAGCGPAVSQPWASDPLAEAYERQFPKSLRLDPRKGGW